MTAQKDAIRRFAGYFSRNEKMLWGASVGFIIVSFCMFDRESYMTLCASLIGVTSLIFNAKGNPFGQMLAVVFSLLYGGISYTFAYYGEMITYLGMTMPMAVFALISWMRNPYNGNKAEVKVNAISRKETVGMCGGAAAGTAGVDFLRALFPTANLVAPHRVGDHQLSGRLPDLPEKPLFCAGLCGERPRPHRPLDPGERFRHPVYFGGGLLCGVLCQRSLRLYQLAENEGAAGAGLLSAP